MVERIDVDVSKEAQDFWDSVARKMRDKETRQDAVAALNTTLGTQFMVVVDDDDCPSAGSREPG